MKKLYLFRSLHLHQLTAFLLLANIAICQTQTPRKTAINSHCGGFYEYLPVNYNSSGMKYPLMIFIHGIGEVGNGTTDLAKVLANGPPKLIAANKFPATFTVKGKTYSFIVLSPQFTTWPSTADVNAVLNYALAHYRVDVNRIYITGLSMGGAATWDFAANSQANATKIAALLPVCGATSISTAGASNIADANLPVWATHNARDNRVGVSNTINNVNNIDANKPPPNPKAIKSIFDASGHDAWTKTYDPNWRDSGHNVYEWMLLFARGSASPPPTNTAPIANAGKDQTITLPINSVSLNGTGSNDPDGMITGYKWEEISGPKQYNIGSATSASTSMKDLVQGTYVLRLTVTDNQGALAQDDVTINVLAAPPKNLSPIANAGGDQSITLPTNSVTLDGSTSKDPDGNIASYKWTEVSGPAQYSIVSAANATTALNNLVQGTYVMRLTVTDNMGSSNNDDVTIKVSPAPIKNIPPVANAGGDQSVTLPTNSVTLNGTASEDPDGNIASYKWTEVSGPAQYKIASPGSATTTVDKLVQGTYVMRLTVTDNKGATATDDVTFNVLPAPVNNLPPVANAGQDLDITLPTNSITLNGTASKDPDGSISSYKWTEVSGPAQYAIANASSATTALSNLVHGDYVMRLTVTDNKGSSSSDDVTIHVASARTNAPPVANAGNNITITLPTNSVQLNGAASKDPDGSISSYTWTEVSGPSFTINSASLAAPTLTNLVAGVYKFNLKVTDNDGASANGQVTITVNLQPVVQSVNRVRVLIDAGLSSMTTPSPDAWGKYWNNFTDGRPGKRVKNAIDTANRPTDISLEVINRIDGDFAPGNPSNNGGNTIGAVGDYPATATNDFMFAHESTKSGKWRIFGLDPSTTYTIKFWGSKSYASQRVIRMKRSDQSAWQSYDADWNKDYNRAAIFTVTGVKEVSFDIQVQSGIFGYINVIDIVGVGGTNPLTRSSGDLQVDAATTPPSPEPILSDLISVYPNPVKDEAQLMIRNKYLGKVKMTMLDAAGGIVNESTLYKDENIFLKSLQLSKLPAGVYYVRIQFGTEVKVLKFVRE